MDADQLSQLQIFLSEMRNQVSQGAYFHYGDLIWRMNNLANDFDESRDIRVWKKDDTVIGFVFDLVKENNPEFFIRPEFYNSVYMNEMLDYSIEYAKSRNEKYIETSCLKSDKIKEEYLAGKGFKKQDDIIVVMECRISNTAFEAELPLKYSFIKPEECDNYHNLLNWLSGRQLNKLLNLSDIDNCLRTLICFENREIVSGSICWYDISGNCGLFEPVETSGQHRKKGLGFTGMKRSLSELKAKGAAKAYVKTGSENSGAVSLYKKLGFEIIDEDYGWRLELQRS